LTEVLKWLTFLDISV